MRNEYVILSQSRDDSTPIGIILSKNGEITLRTNNTYLFNSLSSLCNDNHESWARHLATGSPLASIYRGGYTAMSDAGDPTEEDDQDYIAAALKKLSPLRYDETLYTGKW
jgi:hypothetical protein